MRKLLPLLLLLFALPAKAQTFGQAFFYSGGSAGGSGTVTSIATTAPITGGTITTTGTIGCATCVTSAAALTSNAVVIGGGGQASSTISADTTTTHALFATAGAPAFRALASGDLPAIAIPATVSSATSGGIPCFDSTTDMNTSAAIGAGVLVKGGGAGACVAASLATDNGTTLAYTGTGGITGPNGAVSTPAFNFAGQTGLGFYRRAADEIGVADTSEIIELSGSSPVGVRLGSGSAFQWTNAAPGTSPDTGVDRLGPGIVGIGNGNGANASGFSKSAMTVFTAADVTCGTTGTIADCTTAQTVTGLSITLPLSAQSWTFDCDGVVDQATGTAANEWLIQTSSHGATNTVAYYMMATAAGVSLVGAVTGQAATTTAFQITPSWTLGATGTKMPFHIWGTLSGVSASGTVFNLQVINPTNADLLTIYQGASCSLRP